MKTIAFGTDGIRGKVGTFPINAEGFKIVSRACRLWLQQRNLPLTIAVGWDTRQSGASLARAFAEGMGSEAQVTLLGVTPTPAISFYTQREQVSLGVSITASHNPYTDNGLKLFKSDGAKLRREEEVDIESLCSEASAEAFDTPTIQTVSGSDYYLNAWKQQLPKGTLKGRKIVLDTANGATVFTTLPLLRYLGADLIAFGDQPNGENINCDCGSEHAGRGDDLLLGHPCYLGRFRRCEIGDALGQLVEAETPLVDEVVVVEILGDDDVQHCQRNGRIAARTYAHVDLCTSCQVVYARVDDDDLRAALHAVDNPVDSPRRCNGSGNAASSPPYTGSPAASGSTPCAG